MKHIIILHFLILLALPLLLPDTSFTARIVYWSIAATLIVFAIILHFVYKRNGGAFGKQQLREGNGFLFWYVLFFAFNVALIFCINIERFPALDPYMKVCIDIGARFIHVVNRYEAASLMTSTRYQSNINKLDVSKVQVTTVLSVTYATALLLYLAFRAVRSPFMANVQNTRLQNMNPLVQCFSFFLAIFCIYQTYLGEMDIDLTPARRDICITNFYCYADDGLLIFWAAHAKIVLLILFPWGAMELMRSWFSRTSH